MTDDQGRPPTDRGHVCVPGLEAAEALCDPVEGLLALAELADRAAAAVREIDAATSRAVRRALRTMSLDELSGRLHRSSGDVLFLTTSFVAPPEDPPSPTAG